MLTAGEWGFASASWYLLKRPVGIEIVALSQPLALRARITSIRATRRSISENENSVIGGVVPVLPRKFYLAPGIGFPLTGGRRAESDRIAAACWKN